MLSIKESNNIHKNIKNKLKKSSKFQLFLKKRSKNKILKRKKIINLRSTYNNRLFYSILILFLFVSSYQSIVKVSKRFFSNSINSVSSEPVMYLISFAFSLIIISLYLSFKNSNSKLFTFCREQRLISVIFFVILSCPLFFLEKGVVESASLDCLSLGQKKFLFIKSIVNKFLFGDFIWNNIYFYVQRLPFVIYFCLSDIAGVFGFITAWSEIVYYYKKLNKKNKTIISNILKVCAIFPLIFVIINLFIVRYYYGFLPDTLNITNSNAIYVFKDLKKNCLYKFLFFKTLFFICIFLLLFYCSILIKKIVALDLVINNSSNNNNIDKKIIDNEKQEKSKSNNIVVKKTFFHKIFYFFFGNLIQSFTMLIKSSDFVKYLYFLPFSYMLISLFNGILYKQVSTLYVDKLPMNFFGLKFGKYKHCYDSSNLKTFETDFKLVANIILELFSVLLIQMVCILVIYFKFLSIDDNNCNYMIKILFICVFSLTFCNAMFYICYYLFDIKIYFFNLLFGFFIPSAFEKALKYMFIDALIERSFFIMSDNLVNNVRSLIKDNSFRFSKLSGLIIIKFLLKISKMLFEDNWKSQIFFSVFLLFLIFISYLMFYICLTKSIILFKKYTKKNKQVSE